MENLAREALAYSVYFAPRGKMRLYNLGNQLSQRYLSPTDQLIGFIGDSGAGKSILIKGMFPGLELTNDDDGINVRPLPILRCFEDEYFNSHTFHMDVRFESAFTQMHKLADAVKKAIDCGKRVVMEHFDLIYDQLGMNAQILVGVGEEVIVTRPSLFGPIPADLVNIVFKSIKIRKMVHTAEDLTFLIMEETFNTKVFPNHNDVKHGFILEFAEKPNVDLDELERLVNEYIAKALDVSYSDDTHICIGEDKKHKCTGPRIHVRNTSEIVNFQLLKEIKFDPFTKLYSIVGIVGDERPTDLNDINKLSL